jgi:Rieske 2Fe-2S family protein
MTTFLHTADTFVAGSHTLMGKYYTSPEIFDREQECIFGKRWICIGRSEQLADPGEYFLSQVGGESLIVVRDASGRLNAYFNVCRHRGTRLCEQERGKFSATIQCPYHAWTYNLWGELIGAPLMDEVAGFDKADYPLHRAALAEWGGFLFVNLHREAEPFETAFAPFIGKFSQWKLPELRVMRRAEYQVKANWKLIVQNYSECYHCPLIHPALARRSPYRSGYNDLYSGPFLGGFMLLNEEFGSMTMSGRACAAPIGVFSAEEIRRVYYYAIFPQMLLSLHPDYVMVHTLWPVNVAETRVVCEWLFDPKASTYPGFDPDDAMQFWDMTNRQDWHVCELSQLGVSSRRYSPSPYSSTESLLAAFDQEYLRALGEEGYMRDPDQSLQSR